MRIKTRLALGAGLVAAVAAVLISITLMVTRDLAAAVDAHRITWRAGQSVARLQAVGYDYLLSGRERALQQWQSGYTELLPLVASLRKSQVTDPGLVARVVADTEKLGTVFGDFVAAAGGMSRLSRERADLIQIHFRHLQVELTGLSDDLGRLDRRNSERVVTLKRRLRAVALTGLLLSALALGIVAYWLNRTVLRPLAHLTATIKGLSIDNLQRRTGIDRNDEVGDLARGFDRMTERVALQTRRLREREAELAVANRVLEEKVAERTAQLDKVNADLEQAIRQLYDAGTELAHSERLVTLGKLAASVSHELNNPLMGALNYVQHARADLNADPADKTLYGEQCALLAEWLGKAERDIVRASRVTRNMLDFGRKREERRRAIAPAELVVDTLELVTPALQLDGVVAENQVPQNLRAVFGERELLRQVLLNLILNAINAMKHTADKRIIVGGRAAKDRIELFVQDTGPGVPEPIRERIFEPFFTTKAKGEGTGLGLSIARRLIEGGGGTLSYEPGDVGACFVLRLPPFEKDGGKSDTLVSADSDLIASSSETEHLQRG